MFAVFCIIFAAIGVSPLSAQSDLVSIRGENQEDGSIVLLASSDHIIPVYLNVDLPQLISMETDAPIPYGTELPPGAVDVELFRLTPTRSSGRIGYSVSYTYARGNPFTAVHDDEFRYLIPFAHGEKRRLSQGFYGRFSHTGENQYAVDFEMPVGTEVYAARGGIVAEVKEDSRRGGPSPSYNGDGNYVLIMHEDGSFANYVHLQFGGAIVEPGDIVTEGELIAYSGNTGRSSGPHLHFDVRLPQPDGTMQSIPFQFRGEAGARVEPTEGLYYYAFHPEGDPFDIVLGRLITLDDYEGYAEPFRGTNGLEVRVEQVDLTFLIFLQNGLDRTVDVTMAFDLRGLSSDAGTNVASTVPQGTEILATILRPREGATSIQYGYRLSYR